ncbi:MAG: glycosyltransferase [Bacteroidales bacterium]
MINKSGLYIVFHGFAPHSGITQKIHSQLNAFHENGIKMRLCLIDVSAENDDIITINNEVIHNFGHGFTGKIRKRFDFNPLLEHISDNFYDFIYIRYYGNASPFFTSFIKSVKTRGKKVLIEIPTYPYDEEYKEACISDKIKHWIDIHSRDSLFKQTDYVVTYSDDNYIFGCKTIRISNGIDFNRLPLRKPQQSTSGIINLIIVGELHYWHGIDRIIEGLAEYNSQNPPISVKLNIVGQPSTPAGYKLKEQVEKSGLTDNVYFHGPLYGKSLDDLFDQMDLAIGSLGRHRSGISQLKSLKNREYAARGIPFVYSETDPDFDGRTYTMHIPADETPLDIKACLNFLSALQLSAEQIRNSVYPQLSWNSQIGIIINNIYK